MKNELSIDRSWIRYIDSNIIDVYPIQFANCDRLYNNDAVYIFDEVGSGKTISSGLMALDYLVNNPQEEVYIITTNALVKKRYDSEYGQFLKDWYEKLPFYTLRLTDRIKVVNNHYSNIKRLKKCGLLIVDEAQLFLNEESLRNSYLSKIKSDKIIFLTATPIKTSKNDLYTYVSLARKITQKHNLDDKWIEEINTEGKENDSIICSVFDVNYPMTRYFKDTIMSINVEGYKKKQARRLIPCLWEYGSNTGSKKEVLLNKINECYDNSSQSKFVIFTRFVEKEAIAIGEFLKENGFCPFDSAGTQDCKTYKIVFGDNSCELSNYSGHNNLPTVLILTYQIAEQGVNLPGYNYVINYHISAFPSALEQRFGRIDRMGKSGSIFSEINMCFLISDSYWDTNTWNFYSAMSVYMRNLITYLPSKNTILSEEIISKYLTKKECIEQFINKINDLIRSDQQVKAIVDYFEKIASNEQTTECACDKELFSFIDENSIEIDMETYGSNKEEVIRRFRMEINDKLAEYKEVFNRNGEISNLQLMEFIKTLGDKIFYCTDGKIKTVDAIEECGKSISKCESFIRYKTEFSEKVKVPIVIAKYSGLLNKFFETKFIENDFSYIFPFEGYKKIFEAILDADNRISKEEKQLLVNNSKSIVLTLPFFKMCNMFKDIIQNMPSSMRWGREGYDYNPFQRAFYQIYHKVRQSDVCLGLSQDFFHQYFDEKEKDVEWYDRKWNKHVFSNIYVNSEKYYNIIQDENTVLHATNWYKLAYHFTRKEALYWKSDRWCSGNENVYYRKDRLIEYLVQNYEAYKDAWTLWDEEWYEYNQAYKVAMDGEDSDFNPKWLLQEMGIYGEPEQPEIVCEYEMKENKLKSVIQDIENKSQSQSLFSFYYFTESGYIRKYSFDIPYINNGKVLIKDIWTQGIIYELYGQRYQKCMIGNIYSSPEILKTIYICY